MKTPTKKRIVTSILIAVLLPSLLAGQDQENNTRPPHYSVRNLGRLGGVLGIGAHSVNDHGLIAGVANLTGDNEEHAALWQDGVVSDLGTLGWANSNVDFPIKNNDGLVVGFAQTPETDPLGENFCMFLCTPSGGACNGRNQSCRGFRWRNGLMEPLGTLGGNNSAATGANNRGLVVGLAENTRQDPNCVSPQVLDYEAVVWRGDAIHELSPVPGDAIGAALAVNDNSQIVGSTGMCGSGPGRGATFMHAVLWKNHSPADLGNLGGAFNNIAYAINNRGQIVGASDLASDRTGHAFLWDSSVMIDLGTLAGDFSSAAFAIDDRGEVVGQSCDVNFNCRAFLWRQGVMTDLNVLTVGSLLYLIDAADINSRGEIVGTGVDQQGEPLAFLAVPCDDRHVEDQGCQESAQLAVGTERPRVVLPENLRDRLRERSGFGRSDSAEGPGGDFLKEPLGIDFGSTANSCYPLGHHCTSFNQCCSQMCGVNRYCCDRRFRGQGCTSNADCCSGLCLNHRCSGS